MPKESKSDLKNKIRSTTRLLAKKAQTLSATQLLEIQRKLSFLKTELSLCESSSLELKLHTKYKYVKFVEIKKSARNVKQLRVLIAKKGPAGLVESSVDMAKSVQEEVLDDESKYASLDLMELQAELRIQTDNFHYTTHYPRDFKYISLFTVDPKSLALVEEIKMFISARVEKEGVKENEEMRVTKKDIFGERKVDDKPEDDKDDFFM